MDFYNQIAKGYDGLYLEEQSSKLSIIKSSIETGNNTKILDVGCGSGISSQFECRVVGVDPSIELIKQNPKPKIIGIAEMLPFKNNSFDYVISVTSIHNFKNIKKSIGEIKRVGKENFVFSVLKKSVKFDLINELIQKSFIIEKVVDGGKDVIYFCGNKLPS